MVTTPAERILAAFEPVSADAREILGEALELQSVPFLKQLGSALTYGPKLATLVIRRALSAARWGGSADLIDLLSDDEPWKTIRECLSEAIGQPRTSS
jgi:hypothetical protein